MDETILKSAEATLASYIAKGPKWAAAAEKAAKRVTEIKAAIAARKPTLSERIASFIDANFAAFDAAIEAHWVLVADEPCPSVGMDTVGEAVRLAMENGHCEVTDIPAIVADVVSMMRAPEFAAAAGWHN